MNTFNSLEAFESSTMLFVLLLATIVSAECFSSRIVGGTGTTINKHPYQVAIHYNDELFCGGSIISKDWILTAAHCVYGKKAAQIKVRIASTYSNKEGILISGISTIVYHEAYDDDDYNYDVGLIKFPSPLTFNDRVKAIKLPPPSIVVAPGSQAIVTGWGNTSKRTSVVLQVLTVPIVEQKTCENIFLHTNLITAQMLCAGHMTGDKDTCQGDSGGPLVQRGVQIGIVSWGARCATPGYPGVYTRVSSVRSWITKRAGV